MGNHIHQLKGANGLPDGLSCAGMTNWIACRDIATAVADMRRDGMHDYADRLESWANAQAAASKRAA